ncbi:MAG: LytTR family DNA-binding domain-containing protein [Tunicatimonas sp.]|uniref:LytR/AlgR family response regulator transcription factor n=1 Tax=Tunicatimonas sp. TaxID=1940096 RepID=UPI003C72DB1E
MIQAIAIDDSPSAIEVIRKHSIRTPGINLLQGFTRPLEALDFLKEHQLDVVFIDIEMPGISGIEFIRVVTSASKSYPKFIITSAHDQYAIDGFDLDVVDFLLKPISYERFIKSTLKLNRTDDKIPLTNNKFCFIRSEGKSVKLRFDDILFIQSDGHFVKIHLKNNSKGLHLSYSLTQIESILSPGVEFLRIHKQYIINFNYVVEISSSHLSLEHTEESIPIGTTYRQKINALGIK